MCTLSPGPRFNSWTGSWIKFLIPSLIESAGLKGESALHDSGGMSVASCSYGGKISENHPGAEKPMFSVKELGITSKLRACRIDKQNIRGKVMWW